MSVSEIFDGWREVPMADGIKVTLLRYRPGDGPVLGRPPNGVRVMHRRDPVPSWATQRDFPRWHRWAHVEREPTRVRTCRGSRR